METLFHDSADTENTTQNNGTPVLHGILKPPSKSRSWLWSRKNSKREFTMTFDTDSCFSIFGASR